MFHVRVGGLAGLVLATLLLTTAIVGCNVGGSGNDPKVARFDFSTVVERPGDAETDVLTVTEIEALIEAAASFHNVNDTSKFPEGPPRIAIAITDRIGNILQVWNSDVGNSQPGDFDNMIATSLARTAAYMSHTQAPLTSRTMQFLHSFHFPVEFETGFTIPYNRRFERIVFPPPQAPMDPNAGDPFDAANPDNCNGTFIDPERFNDPMVPDVYRNVMADANDPTLPAVRRVNQLYAPVRRTLGVLNTAQAPLWEIATTNRGGLNEVYDPGQEIPRLVNPDGTLPSPGFTPLPGGLPLYKATLVVNSDCPPPPDPAGTPTLNRRHVGAIGVYISTNRPGVALNKQEVFPELAEEAAFAAARTGNPFRNKADGTPDDYTINGTLSRPLETEGGVFLNGVLLPYIGPTNAPLNSTAFNLDPSNPAVFQGSYDPAGLLLTTRRGVTDPCGWLISPRDSYDVAGGGLTAEEVSRIILENVASSQRTHAAIRLPAISACQMIIAISDFDGTLLGVYREPDATLFSLEVSISKARNAYYYSNASSVDEFGPKAGRHPLSDIFDAGDDILAQPPGIGVTARSLAFLTQPAFPSTIDGSGVAPLLCLLERNATAEAFNRMGFAPLDIGVTPNTNFGDPNHLFRTREDPNSPLRFVTPQMQMERFREVETVPTNQSGIVFFPGAVPLYRNGQLVGGLGVSGDGVEQDDIVTIEGVISAGQQVGVEYRVPARSRCDRYSHKGVRIPYQKFPDRPGA